MIFVVKSGIKRDVYDTRGLREKLYNELNQEGKHQIVRMTSSMIITVRI